MTRHRELVPKMWKLQASSLFMIFLLIGNAECYTETFNLCCALGENWAEGGEPCSSFPPPVAEVAPEQQAVCLATVEICCSRRRRSVQCQAGQRAAKQQKDCAKASLGKSAGGGGGGEDFHKDCCEACNIGLLVGSSGMGCQQAFSFGATMDTAFKACCEEAAKNILPSRPSTQAPESILAAEANNSPEPEPLILDNLCDMLPGELCAHICTPVPGSYVCECRPGFSLMSDGKSCQLRDLPDRCMENNPCNQKCLDIGYAIECSCELGYELMGDKVTCADIDECARQTHNCPMDKTCVNKLGGFTCESAATAATGSVGITAQKKTVTCPVGYQYNAASQVCDDVDECLLKIVKCANCHNTIGSYTCVEEGPTPLCPKGYKYNEIQLTCIDVDECMEAVDDCNRKSQFCLNTLGGFNCQNKASKNTCPPGFKINTRLGNCEDIDECAMDANAGSICANGEVCINEPGQYRCMIYQGPNQESESAPRIPDNEIMPRYEVSPLPSLKDTAAPTKSIAVTESLQQKSSIALEQDKIPSPSPSAAPTVTPQYSSSTAATKTATSAGTTPRGVGVTCKTGFKQHPFTNECVDVNECSERKHTCDSTQDCINLPGSYACQCKAGYTLDHVTQGCVDINECLTSRHSCLESQRCDNTIGSYQCIRYINCGTGYTLNAATGGCEDDDECSLGLHDCHRLGPMYRCRNTQGSYRCERKRTSTTTLKPVPIRTPTVQTNRTGDPTRVVQPTPYKPPIRTRCPMGYERDQDVCIDVNECERNNPCTRFQRCSNSVGSYSCINNIKCRHGFKLNEDNQCEDIDECSEGLHECTSGQLCKNRIGTYACHCPPGHFMTKDKHCEDIDECAKYGSRICHKAVCQNTVGSYRCDCKPGYRSREDGLRCVDIDECHETPGLCQHKCHNLWGSFRCSCQAGFKLHTNNRSCVDIDECEEFKDRYLCIGICKNTPGSYECQCPSGYKLGADGRTCQDIDECVVEQPCDTSNVCINTRGSYECYEIQCPLNYVKDRKNTCKKASDHCHDGDLECAHAPWTYSYNFINFVSRLPIPRDKGHFELFEIRTMSSHITFEMVQANAPANVEPATKDTFSLRLIEPNVAILSLVKSIEGPQQIELEFTIKYYSKGIYQGTKVSKLFIYVSQYEF